MVEKLAADYTDLNHNPRNPRLVLFSSSPTSFLSVGPTFGIASVHRLRALRYGGLFTTLRSPHADLYDRFARCFLKERPDLLWASRTSARSRGALPTRQH